ncbi:MAG: hypothetical protein ACXVDC_16200 [Bacteroidia bacterium]
MKNQTIFKSPTALLTWILILMFSLFTSAPVKAQVNVSVNISSQSLWGPVGYDYVEYYYIPEADVFYYVPTAQFIYFNGGNYVFVNSLPANYHVNLYSTYIVVINEPKPYLQHNIYISNYGKYKNSGRNHISIRDSGEEKYFVVKGHPKHNSVNKNQGSDKGNSSIGNKQTMGGRNNESVQFNDGNKGGGNNNRGGNNNGSQKQSGSQGHGRGK